ncbi:MAG: nitrile hydratase accessory protein [Dehalococcoidia bacterium]
MTTYRPNRNLVSRHLDGKVVNVARFRGNLFFCDNACCCGRTDLKNAPVPADLYHEEWMRRRLRNYVHLTAGGCLGPCALANVALLVLDGQALWFHSMNDEAVVSMLFDYIEGALASNAVPAVTGPLAGRQFTASTWQPRPDGVAVDDLRPWRGRDSRPDPTAACELPDEAFVPSDYGCTVPAGEESGIAKAVAAMDGVAAVPRKNGELVFEEPWHGRAFGMAVGLHEQGVFEWEPFRQRLIARIAEAERRPEPFEYYRCWLAALEDMLADSGLAAPGDVEERAFEFEFGERQDVY